MWPTVHEGGSEGRVRIEWPPRIKVGVYDPVSDGMWTGRETHRYTNIFYEVWQHVKHRLLGVKVTKVYFVMESVDCSCPDSVHKRCLLRTASMEHANEIARNYQLSYDMMWAIR